MNILKKIKKTIKNCQDERDKTAIAKAIEFAKGNENYVVLVLDIESDDVVIAHREHYIATRLVSKFMKLKKKIVKNILKGNMKDKKTSKNVNFIKDIVGEFLWQLNEHEKFREEYDSLDTKKTFQEFMTEKRKSRSEVINNKKK